ncbi:MAG: PAS domain S-box protein, partial [Verrucomicrobiota bacterium]|nr:PAS domain S-box protein [Verrucomicrobiota bacterium]
MEQKKIRVLLVEDNEDDVLFLRGMLEKATVAHFELENARTLAQTFSRLRQGTVDIVLMNLSLPDSAGLETFYKTQREAPEIPIIVLSGLDDETIALQAVHAGAQDYLVKGKSDSQILIRAIIYAIERTQAKTALSKAEEKYRSIFENAVEGIFQTTADGHYLSANPALVRIYGYSSPQELISDVTDIERRLYVNPNRRAEFVQLMQEQGFVADFESEIHRKDGSVIWISENARAVRDANGKLLYYEGLVEDITQRKHAEETLRFSEMRFRSIWEKAFDGMRLTDDLGTIKAVNPAFCKIVGMKKEELEEHPFTVTYSESEDGREMMEKYRERFAERKIETQLERHVTFRSGKTADVELSNSFVEMEKGSLLL